MLQWIILGLFAATMVWQVMKAIKKPMMKNVLTMIAIPISFVITFILHKGGLFTNVMTKLLESNEEKLVAALGQSLPAELASQIPDMVKGALPTVATLLAPALFVLVFNLVFGISKLLYVRMIAKYFKNRAIKREKKELRNAIRAEKQRLAETIRENEERNRAFLDTLPEEQQRTIRAEYQPLDDDEIEDLVEKRVKEESKRRKKQGYYRESGEHKAISILAGAVCGFLLCAINFVPMFYWMDLISDVTNNVLYNGVSYNTSANEEGTKIYNGVKFIDKYIVQDYEKSFVIETYESFGIIDLMNNSVKQGAIIGTYKDKQGEEINIYATEVASHYISYTLRLSCALLDVNYVYDDEYGVSKDVEAIFDHYTYQNSINKIATFIATNDKVNAFLDEMLAKDTVNEDGSPNFINTLMANIFGVYKNGTDIMENGELVHLDATQVVANDLNTVSDVVVVMIKHNKLLSNIIKGDMETLLEGQNNTLLSDLIAVMSQLSGYKPAMESVFTMGVEMIGGIEFIGLPKTKEDGYQLFLNRILTALGNIDTISSEDYTNLQELLKGAGDFQYNDAKIEYVQNQIEAIRAKEDVEGYVLTEDDLNEIARLEAKIAELEAERDNPENQVVDKTGIFAYVLDPINIISMIQQEAKDMRDGLENDINAKIEEINDRIHHIIDVYREEKARVIEETKLFAAAFTNGYFEDKPVTDAGFDGEKVDELVDNRIDYLKDPQNKEQTADVLEEIAFWEILKNKEFNPIAHLEQSKAALESYENDRINNLTNKFEEERDSLENIDVVQEMKDKYVSKFESIQDAISDISDKIQARVKGFGPFATYFMSWMTVQKPFMLAGEDVTSANLSMYIDQQLYVVNTDILTIEKLLDLVSDLGKTEEKHEHNFVDGKCECGEDEPHEHNFVDCVCECGVTNHNFVDGTCECGEVEHVHNFVEGECECGEVEHVHNFVDCVCECGVTNHNFVNCVCECGATNHIFVDGVCECGETGHTHNFVDYKCEECGEYEINIEIEFNLNDYIPEELNEFLDKDVTNYINEMIDQYLGDISFMDLIQQFNVRKYDAENEYFEGKVSPASVIISHLIANAPGKGNTVDLAWLADKLDDLNPNANVQGHKTLLEEMLAVLADSSKGEDYYKELTVSNLKESLNFDAWYDADIKAADTEELLGIITGMIDVIKGFIEELAQAVTAEEDLEGDDAEAGSSILGGDSIELIMGILRTLGKTMDIMGRTECLKELPFTLFEVLLKNETLSMVMTGQMLYGEEGYLTKLDAIKSGEGYKSENENGEEITVNSYEGFMDDFLSQIEGLLDKLNNQEDSPVVPEETPVETPDLNTEGGN